MSLASERSSSAGGSATRNFRSISTPEALDAIALARPDPRPEQLLELGRVVGVLVRFVQQPAPDAVLAQRDRLHTGARQRSVPRAVAFGCLRLGDRVAP